jgi:hypothetical protein
MNTGIYLTYNIKTMRTSGKNWFSSVLIVDRYVLIDDESGLQYLHHLQIVKVPRPDSQSIRTFLSTVSTDL